eukprot:Phypoly_transcript_16548.p1 GENE.Phypoly_transcript_16548~~Phypoly_transcript_16548.p1  ORF type:complete len:233 (+),score=47.91 Phypoly_transcript_16548:117-815(+)
MPVRVSVFIPSYALPPFGNVSFTAVEVAGWVHDPEAFDSDSSYDINQEGDLRSPIVTIDPIDTSIQSFSRPLSFTFPTWWNETSPTPDINYFCLAFLNKTSNLWMCVGNSSISLVSPSSKRSNSSTSSTSVHLSGNAISPGSYAILANGEPVNTVPLSPKQHKHNKAGKIAGITIGVLVFVAICVAIAIFVLRKKNIAIFPMSFFPNLLRTWSRRRKTEGVKMEDLADLGGN